MSASTTEHLSDVAKASNEFSFHLYKTLLPTTKDQNIFFSPISITTVLSMTHLGARGQTADQMKQVLRFQHIEDAQYHRSFKEMNQLLYTSDGSNILKSANRLFSHQGFRIQDEFLRQTKTHYGSELATHDFIQNSEEAVKAINAWVERETDGKIKGLIQNIDPMIRLILINAIYFKGMWLQQFDEQNTRKSSFYVSSKDKLECNLMYQKREFNLTYDSENKCAVLDLPYKGNDLSMLIVLPDEVDGLTRLENKLSASLLQSWTSKLESEKVELWLPKFSLSQKFQLNDALTKMGMGYLFDAAKADLSGIAEELFVSEVIHKAFIEVNEEGSEAAAATAVKMMKRSIELVTQFRADHPFLFVIRDRRTEVALFMGRMAKPPNGNGHDEL
ncbi:leukocyte elastase inhibitor-like isoform X2 [Anneissia japonica]|nr:leukocyte elastase inhibitor-like isoform X2 [Anneissia japonica]XP_033117899.1 leukocyte elastase inhibitor-like isoform X2 [Anneissia japonica]XP_033117900.1 leukocyte elastase inhibitor-like isoform X2 [Anneissia japonica]